LPIAIRDRFHFIGVLVFIGHIIEEQEVGDPAFLDALQHLYSAGELPVTVDALLSPLGPLVLKLMSERSLKNSFTGIFSKAHPLYRGKEGKSGAMGETEPSCRNA
jgi:hypothetical protein